MPNYRRRRDPGGIVFLTVVTCARRPLFRFAPARKLLRESFAAVCRAHPWTTEAIVLMPDHWHALWRLPPEDSDYSLRVSRVKKTFTDAWLAAGGTERQAPPAQRGSRRRGVWQVKFWEHTIRDAADFKRHLDYIHLNPVKHGLAKRPRDWAWSSFRRWVELGEYELDWLGPTGLSRSVKHYWYDE